MTTAGQNSTVALIGANGMLARMVCERAPRGYSVHGFDLPDFDMTDRAVVMDAMAELRPDVIINCAAYTNVDKAEAERSLAAEVNGTAVGNLVQAASSLNAILVHISTDYVFDGTSQVPYTEKDRPNPMSVYGQSKLFGEQAIVDTGLKKFLIIRTSWMYGPYGNNFVETILRLAGQKEELRIINDQVGCPTYTADLADAIFNLLDKVAQTPGDDYCGIYHYSNEGECSWFTFAEAIVEEAKSNNLQIMTRQLHPIKTEEYPLPARRPAYSVFDKSKYKAVTGSDIPDWQDSLKAYFKVRAIENQEK